ncbi:MAG: hypothetical protein I3270_02065 [Candidatus Moeniiplasma glomeromycotorum]|nr:hypothetical protein [Candidatus Moeniiplasma glomeromycotorum]MCE8162483.1 hypothetical protein [Candidatus Moeniiplasma glomeromycotorum]MCE8166410.1 hypothetical protein [Candidatus Moeniiplasma glomeromycotorum]MCE8166895.1 hypothetical protein [Candidatus Moeniiplasma glomeromycotorum]
MEELIEVVKKLEAKRDKLDRVIFIVYFYVGKIFYEKNGGVFYRKWINLKREKFSVVFAMPKN